MIWWLILIDHRLLIILEVLRVYIRVDSLLIPHYLLLLIDVLIVLRTMMLPIKISFIVIYLLWLLISEVLLELHPTSGHEVMVQFFLDYRFHVCANLLG